MKPALATVVLSFVLLAFYTKFIGPIPLSITSVTTTKSDTFSVSGEGIVEVRPDVATVNVGVQVDGQTVKVAQESLNARINAVSEAVKQLGISDKDIKTTNYSIYPQYDYREGAQKILGYQASANLLVKARNLDRVNDVIDAATANGANQVGGISFDVDDKEKFRDEARKKAVEDAKSNAQRASSIAGFRLGKIINYSESTGGEPVPMLARTMEGVGGGKQETQVEPGVNEIRLTITLSYEIL